MRVPSQCSSLWVVLLAALCLLVRASAADAQGRPLWSPSIEQLASWINDGVTVAANDVPLADVPGVRRWLWCQQGGLPQVPGQNLRFVLVLTPQFVANVAGWEAAWDQAVWARLQTDRERTLRALAEEIRGGWRNDELVLALGFDLPEFESPAEQVPLEYAIFGGGRWYSLDICGPCSPRTRAWFRFNLRHRGCRCELPPCREPANKRWVEYEPVQWDRSQARRMHDLDEAAAAFLTEAGAGSGGSEIEVWALPGSVFLLAPRAYEVKGRWYRHVACPPAPLLEFARSAATWAAPPEPRGEWWSWPAPPWAASYILSEALKANAPLLYKPKQIEVRLVRLRLEAGAPSENLMRVVPASNAVPPGWARLACASTLNFASYCIADLKLED